MWLKIRCLLTSDGAVNKLVGYDFGPLSVRPRTKRSRRRPVVFSNFLMINFETFAQNCAVLIENCCFLSEFLDDFQKSGIWYTPT